MCLLRLAAAGQELNTLSVGGGGNLAVAGGQGELLFWDRRTRQQLALFEDIHAEAVTQVGPILLENTPAPQSQKAAEAAPLDVTHDDVCGLIARVLV